MAAVLAVIVKPVGLARDEAHGYYWNGKGPIPSVTTILGVVDKGGALVGWAKRETAACAVRNLEMLAAMRASGGDAAAIEWLKRIPDYERDKAADRGSDVHALAEAISRGQDVIVPAELAGYVEAFQAWQRDWRPEYLAAEEMVVSLRHGYAGTFDAIVGLAGETWLIDYKTGKGIYPETGLQLSAYAHADFIGRPGIRRRFRIPPVESFAVLHLQPGGYEFVPYRVTGQTFQSFLAAQRLYQWREGEGKAIKAAPLGPRLREAI